jgi:hypothetical protein
MQLLLTYSRDAKTAEPSVNCSSPNRGPFVASSEITRADDYLVRTSMGHCSPRAKRTESRMCFSITAGTVAPSRRETAATRAGIVVLSWMDLQFERSARGNAPG